MFCQTCDGMRLPWLRRLRFRCHWLAVVPLLMAVYVLLRLAGPFGVTRSHVTFEPGVSWGRHSRLPPHRTTTLAHSLSKNQLEYIDSRGMHVIVGHYVGDTMHANLTSDEINTNDFSPERGAGENGVPVKVPLQLAAKQRRYFHVNEFNLVASDMITLNRSLPDLRREGCGLSSYHIQSLPACSVIIVFHNEAWSTLLRTIHSVINRSPRHLLTEIILVDDASERSFLKQPLDVAIAGLTVPVRIIRVGQRTGLIRARLRGAQEAKARVIVFLDAHCECTDGWLEPLLGRIAERSTALVSPVIDVIDDVTFAYVRSLDLHWGAFNWQLHFRWFALGDAEIQRRRNDMNAPFRTPAMAGGLFAVDRDFFYQIGSYDRDMDIWGGENIEMSLRVWMCGGTVEIHPCSHVGHVFRKNSPYTFPRAGGVSGVLYHNLARVAALWLDEWADFYFDINKEAAAVRNSLDLGHRIRVKQRMKCHSFGWYLKNVWPENFFPSDNRLLAQIAHSDTTLCVQRPAAAATGAGPPAGPASLASCVHTIFTPQLFVIADRGAIMTDESLCLDAVEATAGSRVRMHGCSQSARQNWLCDQSNRRITHIQTGLCLATPTANTTSGDWLIIEACRSEAANQRWRLIPKPWK